ncbi:hypothetical protein RCJ22_19380 [Vibrio sp. FNV 38]|nr:hypothetical protein [Vibrio sp. FNV 38]
MSIGSAYASAIEISSQTAKKWLEDSRSQIKTSSLLEQLEENKVDSVKFAIERLAMPQQEVVRYLLLNKMEQQQIAISSQMAFFVDSQRTMRPTYQILETGDGYEFSAPAFNYPATATRLIKRWNLDQKTVDLVLKAEQGELDLQDYLTVDDVLLKSREDLLIQELSSLSGQALEGLVQQLTTPSITTWLPSSKVMVSLAQETKNEEVYRLLWLVKADRYSKKELSRLATLSTQFAYQQIMLATNNPALRNQALEQLAQTKPMPDDVRSFLVTRMMIEEEAPIVARELVKQGYSQWLTELVTTNRRVRASAINNVLSN